MQVQDWWNRSMENRTELLKNEWFWNGNQPNIENGTKLLCVRKKSVTELKNMSLFHFGKYMFKNSRKTAFYILILTSVAVFVSSWKLGNKPLKQKYIQVYKYFKSWSSQWNLYATYFYLTRNEENIGSKPCKKEMKWKIIIIIVISCTSVFSK